MEAAGRRAGLRRALKWTAWIALTLGVAFAALCGLVAYRGRIDEAQPADAIVVLGAAVFEGGQPSPVLAARVAHAVRLYQRGLAPVIVFSGGVGAYLPSEAEVMARLAREAGVPAEALILEMEAHTTQQSVRLTAPLLDERGIRSIIVVTSPFHLFRATRMYRDAGYAAYGSAGRSSVDQPACPAGTHRARSVVLCAISVVQSLSERSPNPGTSRGVEMTQQQITVRRAGVGDASKVAAFINRAWHGRAGIDAQAVLGRLGNVGFLLAERDDELVGMLGWQVENLVVRVFDFLVWPAYEGAAVGRTLFASMEQAAKELQCEVALLFLPRSVPSQVIEFFKTLGYAPQVVASLPQAWREAAYEGRLGDNDKVFIKKLRADRVLRPI